VHARELVAKGAMSASVRLVAMPEISIDEDNETTSRQDKVGLSWEPRIVESKA
jgi:hypothetical protein